MYIRSGPFGFTASPNVTLNQQWRDGLGAWYREAKLGNPQAQVWGYSSAASAVGEYRVSNQDLEAYVADGYIDAWIDQTWAGAWQVRVCIHMCCSNREKTQKTLSVIVAQTYGKEAQSIFRGGGTGRTCAIASS
jgi:hypothetical protein